MDPTACNLCWLLVVT